MNESFDLISLSSSGGQLSTAPIIACNETTARFGLSLSPTDAVLLLETRAQALHNTGRVELGGGILEKLILAFCDSPYLSQQYYTGTIQVLVESFYYLKSECLELLSDDELLERMSHYFNHSCHGSLELLQGRELELFSHSLRFGTTENEIFDDSLGHSFGGTSDDE